MDKCRECPADRDEAVCGLKFYRYWRGETVSAHAGFWWDAPQDCSLTPAAMRLVKMLIEHGISDEDAELVAKAIAGEGRLGLDTPICSACRGFGYVTEMTESGDARYGTKSFSVSQKPCPKCRQDQGVQKEMMEKSLQDQGGE